VRFHVLPVGAIDHHGFLGAESLRDACGIHRSVATADDPDDATELGSVPQLDLLEQRERVHHLAAVHRWNVEVVRDLCTNCEKHRIEAAGLFLRKHIVDAVVAGDLRAHREDAVDFLREPVAREPIRRYP
jgi:hypothetical protein